MVTFDKKTHTYRNDQGVIYTSGTSFVGKFKPKFESDKHAQRVADREGVTKEEILAKWEAGKNAACDYGTSHHEAMENYIKYGVRDPMYNALYDSYIETCKDYPYRGDVMSETILYNHTYKLAGTADLIIANNEQFMVKDFKTNKRFRYGTQYGEYMRSPISHMPVCEYYSYALQLSLYAYMYEQMTDKQCSGLAVLYRAPDSLEWQQIVLPYLKTDIRLMIAVHNK